MSDIERSVKAYNEKIKEQKKLDAEKKKEAEIKARAEELLKQRAMEEKERLRREKNERAEMKLVKYAESTKPSEENIRVLQGTNNYRQSERKVIGQY